MCDIGFDAAAYGILVRYPLATSSSGSLRSHGAGITAIPLASYVRFCVRAASRRQCAVRVGVRAPKRPSAAFLLRAGAILAENDSKNV